MATAYETVEYQNGVAVNTQGTPGIVRRTISIDLPTLTGDADYKLALNDTIKCFPLPGWVKIERGMIRTNVDLDDHGTPSLELDLQITDGTTTKTLLDNGTGVFDTGNPAIVDSDAVEPSTINALYWVTDNGSYYAQLKAIAAAAGDAASSAVIYVTVEYSRVLEGDEGNRTFPDATP